MKLFREIKSLQEWIGQKKRSGARIGFVPTMGALHEGHLFLVDKSLKTCDITICSIFVNPTQFNNKEDLQKYPNNIQADMKMLAVAGCDAVFHPGVQEMYPDGATAGPVDYGLLTSTLEGAFRPGHFDGVVAVVRHLFDIVRPDVAFFGQKDFQQCAVVSELIHRERFPLELQVCPTMREKDGLAMSSRNTRLSADEREAARAIYQTLLYIKEQAPLQDLSALIDSAADRMKKATALLKPEYIAVVDAATLEPLDRFDPARKTVALIAAWCGNVRLIDNMFLTE